MTEKNVLITGASRGIGRSTAILFAQNGYHVFLNCNKSVEELKQVQEEIEKHHPKAVTLVPGNVGNPSDVRSILAKYTATVTVWMFLLTTPESHISDFLWISLTKNGNRLLILICLPSSTAAEKLYRKWYQKSPVESLISLPCGAL